MAPFNPGTGKSRQLNMQLRPSICGQASAVEPEESQWAVGEGVARIPAGTRSRLNF